jgi:orotidine-5'-phosphate decarboxylase
VTPASHPKDRLILALDLPDPGRARELARKLADEVGLFKIGLELFAAGGPSLVREMADEFRSRIFLDLKLHDIPHTVSSVLRILPPGVALATVHAGIGPTGLAQIRAAVPEGVKLLAVTVLTSLSPEDLTALGYEPSLAGSPAELVVRQAGMAQAAGCHGVVCSGREVAAVKAACGPEFLAVCPGIRPAWAQVAADDQKRTLTPAEALHRGADYLVVGRPVSRALDPAAAARRVADEIALALAAREAASPA